LKDKWEFIGVINLKKIYIVGGTMNSGKTKIHKFK